MMLGYQIRVQTSQIGLFSNTHTLKVTPVHNSRYPNFVKGGIDDRANKGL